MSVKFPGTAATLGTLAESTWFALVCADATKGRRRKRKTNGKHALRQTAIGRGAYGNPIDIHAASLALVFLWGAKGKVYILEGPYSIKKFCQVF